MGETETTDATSTDEPDRSPIHRIEPIDASFLDMESSTVHTHVVGVLRLRQEEELDGSLLQRCRDKITARVHAIPQFRCRPVEVPLGLDRPRWVEEPMIDVEAHVIGRTLASGTEAELGRVVGELAGTQLPRDRPLWDLTVVDGLPDGEAAAVFRVHHALADGMSALGILVALVDDRPDAVDPEPPAPNEERSPGIVDIWTSAAGDWIGDAAGSVARIGRIGRSIGRVTQASRDQEQPTSMARPFSGPKLSFNGRLTKRRVTSLDGVPLATVKEMSKALDVTVNDAFLTAVTRGLGAWLLDRGEPTDEALVATVPMSTHGTTATPAANQVSNMFVGLPVQLSDPREQARLIAADTAGGKGVLGAMGGDVLIDATALSPRAVMRRLPKLFSLSGLPNRIRPIHNLVVSTVPGPRDDLWFAGARVVALSPFGPLMEGSGLNITAMSCGDRFDVGVLGCPDLLPDHDGVLAAIIDSIEELARLGA